MDVLVIGGGASGMAAALAARQAGARVVLLERQARLGRKLQATGNGRCNLTNLNPRPYHGEDPAFADPALAALSPAATLAWLEGLGLLTVAEPSGRVYPYSDQANSVVDVLRFALEEAGVEVFTGQEVRSVQRTREGFRVEARDSFLCTRLVVACGGLAGTKLGGSLSGYQLLAKLGHRATRLRPALVQLKARWGGLSALKGVRANCRAQVLRDGAVFSQSQGELQFTDYGLSGPVLFEISRDACQGPGLWQCRLDFLPQLDMARLLGLLENRRETGLPAEELFTGILHNRLGRVLTRAAGVRDGLLRALSDADLAACAGIAKGLTLPLEEPLGMDAAQVTAGGVKTAQFDPQTLESRLVPGLYACGEVLDIDGDCGGYNLQWAWSSGYLAGRSAGKEPL